MRWITATAPQSQKILNANVANLRIARISQKKFAKFTHSRDSRSKAAKLSTYFERVTGLLLLFPVQPQLAILAIPVNRKADGDHDPRSNRHPDDRSAQADQP